MPLVTIEGVDPNKLGVMPSDVDTTLANFKKFLREEVAANKALAVGPEDVAVTIVQEYAVENDVIIKIYCARRPERTKEVLDKVANSAVKAFNLSFPAFTRISAYTIPLEEDQGSAEYVKGK